MAWAKKNYVSSLWSSLKTRYTPTPPKVVTPPKQPRKNKEEAKDAVKDVEKTAKDSVKNVSDSVSDAINEQKQMMQGVIDYYVEYASRKIDEIQEKLDEINKKFDDMATAAQDRYNDQLAALEDQYNAVEDQYELQKLMDNLEKAKRTYQMVYRDGQFVYEVDAEKVKEAQEALSAYRRKKEYEERKKQLEKSLKNELDYIEKLRKAKTKALEDEKKRWEEYKKGWQELNEEFEFQQNKLLAEQMFGAQQENAMWEVRLANLRSFVSQYKSLMGSLSGGGGGGGGASGSGGVAGDNLWGTGNDNLNTWDLNSAYNSIWDKDKDYGVLLEDAIKKGYGIDWISGVAGQRNAKLKALGLEGKVESTQALFDRLVKQYGYNQGYTGEYGTFQGGSGSNQNKPISSGQTSHADQSAIMRLEDRIANNSEAWFNASPTERERLHAENEQLRKELERLNPNGYASGTTSARSGLAMVGEQGPELRVLNRGDGIVPADITRNLMKIGANPKWFAKQSGAGNTILNVANVSLPSVQNAQQFVDGLKNLALQKAYGRT